MEKEQTIQQPSIDAQRLYMAMVDNTPDEVTITHTRRKYKIRWLKHGQLDRLTRLLIGEKGSEDDLQNAIITDGKIACKAAAIIILDGYWKLKLRYWFLWRWFYYIRQYDDIQLRPILEMGKKKVPLTQFYMTITSLTEAKDSLMRMRAKEVEAILHAQSTEPPSPTENSDKD